MAPLAACRRRRSMLARRSGDLGGFRRAVDGLGKGAGLPALIRTRRASTASLMAAGRPRRHGVRHGRAKAGRLRSSSWASVRTRFAAAANWSAEAQFSVRDESHRRGAHDFRQNFSAPQNGACNDSIFGEDLVEI